MDKNPLKIEKCRALSGMADIEINDHFSDMSFDMALNSAPDMAAFAECVKKLKPGGTLYFFSGISGDEIIPASVLNEIHYRQLRVYGVYGNLKKQMADALKIISGNISLFENLIEKKLTLEEVPLAMDDVLSGTKFKYMVEF
jgi:threonine dehydrogenase-like Zn-dependent dehydrogenase